MSRFGLLGAVDRETFYCLLGCLLVWSKTLLACRSGSRSWAWPKGARAGSFRKHRSSGRPGPSEALPLLFPRKMLVGTQGLPWRSRCVANANVGVSVRWLASPCSFVPSFFVLRSFFFSFSPSSFLLPPFCSSSPPPLMHVPALRQTGPAVSRGRWTARLSDSVWEGALQ